MLARRRSNNRIVALKLAEAGFAVFPCHESGAASKKPKPGVYWRDASTAAAAKIERWWGQWPDALVGLDCGKSGLVVIDADRHGGPDGVAAWGVLVEEHGDPGAPAVATPSDGVHYYFRQPADGEPLGNRQQGLPPGINVRGRGGYVIGPGSGLPDGRVYEPAGDIVQAPPIPDWLVTLLRGEQTKALVPLKPAVLERIGGTRRLDAYAQAAVDGELNALRGAMKGQRNEMLNRASFALGTMAGAGWVRQGEAQGWLTQCARDIGLDKIETIATIRSGLMAGMKQPRGLPADAGGVEAALGAEIARNLIRSAQGDVIDGDTGEVLYERPPSSVSETDWLFPGGLLGAMADWIVDTTPRRPNRPMAMAAAIAIVGTVLGRHLAGPTRSGTHLYITCIGETAAGKDRPMRAISEILDAAGLGFLAISGKFKSDVALENAIADNPCSVATIDEIGQQLFAGIMGRKAGVHQANIGAILREIWPRSFSEFSTSCSAARKGHKIKSPAFSIFGASTVDEFYASLSGASVDNGFINRFLIIRAAKRTAAAPKRIEARDVPGSIVAALLGLLREGNGNMEGGKKDFTMAEAPNFDVMPFADTETETAFYDFEEEVLNDDEGEIVALTSRTAEMALRLATIHAASRAGRTAVLTIEDWTWGKAVAMHSAEIMKVDVRERMSDNDHQAKHKLIERLIREPGDISRRDLLRKLNGRVPSQEVDKILGVLAEADIIRQVLAKSSKGGGRPSARFLYIRDAKTLA